MDETMGEVSTSSSIRGSLALTTSTGQVGVQNFSGLGFVAHVDHAQSSSGLKSVPVGSLGDPSHIVLTETVIGCVRIHHTVHPDDCGVEHRVLLGDGFLDFLDKQHISVIVLLEELKGETLLDFAFEDRQ